MDWTDSLKLGRHVVLLAGFAAVLPGALLAQTAPTSPAAATSPVKPPAEPALLQQATQAIQNKDYPLALQLLDQHLASQPRDDHAYRQKADVLHELDRQNEAVEASRQATVLNPGNSSNWNSLCWQQILANEPLQARASCEKAKAIEPDNWAAIVNLGHTWLLTGDAATAQTYYRDTIWRIKSDTELQEGPQADFEIFIAKGWQRQEAQASLQWFKAAWPKWRHARELGNQYASLEQAGRSREAIPVAEEMLKIGEEGLGTDHAMVSLFLDRLATSCRYSGQYAQALPLYQRALAISEKTNGPEHPGTGASLNNLALLYQDMGQYAQALPLYQRALTIIEKTQGPEHPDTGASLDNLAWLYQAMGQYAQALPLAQRALAISEKTQGPEHPATGKILNNLALLYKDMGQTAQALPLFLRALAIIEKTQGTEHPDTGTSLNNRAVFYQDMGQYAQALPLAQRALAISEKTQGPEHPNTGSHLNNLAGLYQTMGQYAQALPLFQRALAISEKTQGPKHPNTGSHLNNLAGLYKTMGQYAQALPLFQRALAISEKTQGTDHPDTGNRLGSLASLYKTMGQYAQALPLFQRALAISEKTQGPEHPNTGSHLNNLAGLYQTMGQYAQALPLFQRALAISEKTQGPVHPGAGIHLNNLAGLYQAMGQYAQALSLYQRALAISEKAHGPEHPDTGTCLNNLALLYKDMGQYAQALPLFQRALAISEKTLGPEHPNTGASLNDLALLYQAMGQYAQALPLIQRALVISEKVNGPEHPLTAARLNNLALHFIAMGKYAQSLPLLQRSLAISEITQGSEHPETGIVLHNLSRLYREMGRPREALPLVERALAVSAKTEGLVHPGYAIYLNNLADTQLALHRPTDAEKTLHQSLQIGEQAEGADHPHTGKKLESLARAQAAQGHIDEAMETLLRAEQIAAGAGDRETLWKVQSRMAVLQAGRNQPEVAIFWGKQAVNTIQSMRGGLTALERELQAGFLDNKRWIYIDLSQWLVRAGRIQEAQRVMALLKEEELFDFVRRDAASAPAGSVLPLTGVERKAHEQYYALREQLARLAQESLRLEEIRRKGGAMPEDLARLAELKEPLRRARAAFLAFTTGLRQTLASQADKLDKLALLDTQIVTHQTLLSGLNSAGRGVAAVQYVASRDRLSIIVSTQAIQLAREVPIGEAALNERVFKLRRLIQDPRLDPRAAARELHALLIEPIRQDLADQGVHTLMLIPDGTLRYLPFAALHDGQQYLAEQMQLAIYTPAGSPNLSAPPQPGWEVAAFGVTRAFPEQRFAALASVRGELAGIVNPQALPGSILLDEQFTATALEDRLATPVLHIASHFRFIDGSDESYLLLGDGSRLTLAQMRLMPRLDGVDLMTLSACDTATGGGLREDGREVEGLGVEAQKRGARAVLATLWPVADQSTGLLMQQFYRARRGEKINKAQALRQAQLFMLGASGGARSPVQPAAATTDGGAADARGAKPVAPEGSRPGAQGDAPPAFQAPAGQPYAHPYYWAPFILMGNWL